VGFPAGRLSGAVESTIPSFDHQSNRQQVARTIGLQGENAMGTRLYVGNLSYNVTEQELREVFAEGGKNVVEVKVVLDRDTGRPRGFAFVEMGSDAEAGTAVQELSGRQIQGRPINVSEARERAPRSGGGGYGAGGGYGGGGGGGGYGGGGYGGGGGGGGRGGGGGYSEDRGGGGGRGRRGGW
jgi:RNA recognition motif-containing protein